MAVNHSESSQGVRLCLSCYAPAEKQCTTCKRGYYCNDECKKKNFDYHLVACVGEYALTIILQYPPKPDKFEANFIHKCITQIPSKFFGSGELITDSDIIFGDPNATITLSECSLIAQRKIIFFGKSITLENCCLEAEEIIIIGIDDVCMGMKILGETPISATEKIFANNNLLLGNIFIGKLTTDSQKRLLPNMQTSHTVSTNLL